MANQTYFKYIYAGTNDFVSPVFNDVISNIRCFVNSVEVSFSFLTPTSIELDVEPNIGDIVEVLRLTYDNNRLVNFTNNSILKEQDLDKNSDQLFYLIEELKNNDTKDLEFIQGQLNKFVSEKNDIDSSGYVDGNLNNQIQSVQDALNVIDDFTIAQSSDDITIDTSVDGNGNLTGNSTTLSDLISEIDTLPLDDVATNAGNNTLEGENSSLGLQDIVDILNQYQTKNSEVKDTDVKTTPTDGNGNFDSELTTVGDKLNAADGTISGFDPAKQYKTPTPTLSGASVGNEGEILIVTITNYSALNAYNAQASGGSIVFNNNTIEWTLPNVTVNESHSLTIFATGSGQLQSDNGQKDISVVNVPISSDDSIILDNAFNDPLNINISSGFDVVDFKLETTSDNASVDLVTFSQEGGDGDWVSNQESVSIELSEVVTETGTTNNLLRTKEVVGIGDKFLIDTNVADDPQQGFEIVGAPSEVVEGVGDGSVVTGTSHNIMPASTYLYGRCLVLSNGNTLFTTKDSSLGIIYYAITDIKGNIVKPATIVTNLANSVSPFKSAVNGSSFTLAYNLYNDNSSHYKTYDENGNIINSFSNPTYGLQTMCVKPNGNILTINYTYSGSIKYFVEYTQSGSIVNAIDISSSDIGTKNAESLVYVSNGNILFDETGTSKPLYEVDINGNIIKTGVSLYGSNNWSIYNVLENSDEYIVQSDRTGTGQANTHVVHRLNKTDLSIIGDYIGYYPLQYDIDKYYFIGTYDYITYEKGGSPTYSGYSSGSIPSASPLEYSSMFINKDGNVDMLAGPDTTNITDYTINISPGVTTYEVDISSLGLTTLPDAFYFDPDITFSTSMVGTGLAKNYSIKTLDDFNIDVLGNMTITYPTTNIQGRDYNWKIEVPINNRLNNIYNVTSNFTKLG